MLRGRRDEYAVVDRLLEGARAGRSGILLLKGEAGVGKTALLEHAVDSASDMRTVRAAGVESEMELAFAALHQLCVPLLGRLERLPTPQRDALATTFGLSEGTVPDRFFVGLATLGLLSDAADERPLVCVVDDAQWLDRASAQVLAFVGRRLQAEAVVMLFSAREASEELAGLPNFVIEGLKDQAAHDLLASVIPGRLDERVADQIVAETRGNPLALLELPHGHSAAELAGGFGLPGAASLEGKLEATFLKRLEALPEDTQRLVLVAAAEPTGDPALLWRAAERLGIAGPVLEPADSAALLEVGVRVRFRHPLVRSAVYRAASPRKRRGVHRALAEATDAQVDPDRRAWHLAEAAAGPDEGVAAELEQAAERAQARGGLAAAAAFLARATALTPELPRRAQRALAAAQTKYQAGALDDALALLGTAETGDVGDLGRARVHLLRAQIAFASRRGSDAPPLLLKAAGELEAVDPPLARATYLEAFAAALFAGRLARGASVLEVAQAVRGAPPSPPPPPAGDLLLRGLALSNGLTRYEDALGAAEQAAEYPHELWHSNWVAVELIEAASRTGEVERAADALEGLSSTARASGSDWGLGVEARSRALLSDGDAAERLYREAIDRLQRTPLCLDLARTQLLYGEWLRRERRRTDAREQLRTAFEMFTAMGVEAFAARAERELLATGEHVRKRAEETRDELTAQEAQIARLARDGLSNRDIGDRLFISQHTVAYHLRKVFAKLNITSRNQLAGALPTGANVNIEQIA